MPEYKRDKIIGIKCDIKVNPNIIIETLSRIGICNKNKLILTPSCYLKKGINNKTGVGDYSICHFKELLYAVGYKKNIFNDDYIRRSNIASLLEKWGMILIKNRSHFAEDPNNIFVLKKHEKSKYTIDHKFSF